MKQGSNDYFPIFSREFTTLTFREYSSRCTNDLWVLLLIGELSLYTHVAAVRNID
jgi:hypothetical protein